MYKNGFRFFFIALAMLAGQVCAGTPNYNFKVNHTGISEIFQYLSDLTTTNADRIVVSDVDAMVSGTDVNFHSLRVAEITQPSFSYTLSAPNVLSVTANIESVRIVGRVKASRRTLFNIESDEGDIEYSSINSVLQQSFIITTLQNGIPVLTSHEDCTAMPGPANVNVRNIKESYVAEAVELAVPYLNANNGENTCNFFTRLVTAQFNYLLVQVPNVIDISKNISLKADMVDVSTIDDILQIARDFKLLGRDNLWDQAECDLTATENLGALLSVGDALFNSLFQQAFEEDLLDFTITPASPTNIYRYLMLTCAEGELCLGRQVPSLAQSFGDDAVVKLQMKALTQPVMKFKNNKIPVTSSWQAKLFITSANAATATPVASAEVTSRGLLQAMIQDELVRTRVVVKETQVKINQEANQYLQDPVAPVLQKIVQSYTNNVLLNNKFVALNQVGIDYAAVNIADRCAFFPVDIEFYKVDPEEVFRRVL